MKIFKLLSSNTLGSTYCVRCQKYILNINRNIAGFSTESADEWSSSRYLLPGRGHRVFVIQPDVVRCGSQEKVRELYSQAIDHQPSLKTLANLEESCSLVKSLPKWSVIKAEIYPVSWQRHPKYFYSKAQVMHIREVISCFRSSVTAVFISHKMLNGLQLANLQTIWRLPVYDRFTIVLQIFKAYASTTEAKLQVALAELPYLKSRLAGVHTGILALQSGTNTDGSFGNDEWSLEQRRRQLASREKRLKEELEVIENRREGTRVKHSKSAVQLGLPTVAIVGYTNSGKTALVKALTQNERLNPKNRLFATLDVTTHLAELCEGRVKVRLVDTVGFMADIPDTLIIAFHTTLKDALNAHLIIHVRDMSHPRSEHQKQHVLRTLRTLGLPEERIDSVLEVCNKCDLIDPTRLVTLVEEARETAAAAAVCNDGDEINSDGVGRGGGVGPFFISATRGTNLSYFEAALEKEIVRITSQIVKCIRVPADGPHLEWLKRNATILDLELDEDNMTTEGYGIDTGRSHYLAFVRITPVGYRKFLAQFSRKSVKISSISTSPLPPSPSPRTTAASATVTRQQQQQRRSYLHTDVITTAWDSLPGSHPDFFSDVASCECTSSLCGGACNTRNDCNGVKTISFFSPRNYSKPWKLDFWRWLHVPRQPTRNFSSSPHLRILQKNHPTKSPVVFATRENRELDPRGYDKVPSEARSSGSTGRAGGYRSTTYSATAGPSDCFSPYHYDYFEMNTLAEFYDDMPEGCVFNVSYLDSLPPHKVNEKSENAKFTVLALHGALGSHEDLSALTMSLTELGVRVIALNLPGSLYTHPREFADGHAFQMSSSELFKFTIDFLDHIDVDRLDAVLCHSMGSMTAAHLITYFRPLTRIIFISPHPHKPAKPAKKFALRMFVMMKLWEKMITRDLIARPLMYLQKRLYGYTDYSSTNLILSFRQLFMIDPQRVIEKALTMSWSNYDRLFFLAEDERNHDTEDLYEYASYMGFEKEHFTRIDKSGDIYKQGATLRGRSQAVAFDEGGHFFHLKYSNQVAALVTDFLERTKDKIKQPKLIEAVDVEQAASLPSDLTVFDDVPIDHERLMKSTLVQETYRKVPSRSSTSSRVYGH